ncbi:TonB-dependent receptor [Terracidiphilus sp.]|uniref:TonB-dependent receptor n=1 Tax=Terracidiphilus sp. TaxID=1964191 RepID=UPI003C20A551
MQSTKHTKRVLRLAGLVSMLIMLLTGRQTLIAQSDTGSVRGTITDQTGAAIPGAAVVLVNSDNGFTQNAVADATGSFHFEAVLRGNYKVTASDAGFEGASQSFMLNVSQVQTVSFKLKPGSTSTTVQVTDAAPIVDLSTSSVGDVIEPKQVIDLPLNSRNFTQLALLTPGVTRGGYGSAASGQGGNAETWRYGDNGGAALSVNGLRAQANNFELDGLDNNDALVNTIIFFPPVEETDEFRVTTAVAPAEFGKAGGAIIQSSIKSGTNQYHGSLFFFDRDQIFDANPNYAFGNTPQAAPPYRRQQFGGTLGGPLPFLHHKLFLFGGYQGLRLITPEGESFQSVPTPLMRMGNFSELITDSTQNGGFSTVAPSVPYAPVTGCATTPSAVMGTIYDPVTCAPFAGNIIPNGRMSQVAQNYLNAFPAQNNANGSIGSNYFINPQETQHMNDFDVRIDWKPTDKDSFFGRYSYGLDVQNKESLFPNLPAGFGSGYNPVHPRGEAVGYTRIFTPNLVNEFRYGHIYDFFGYIPPFDNIPVSANLGILNANRSPLLGGGAAINGGWLAYTGDGGAYTVPQGDNQYVDQLIWTHGKHSFRFGGSIEKRYVNFFQGNNAKGYFDWSGNQWTGFSVADMLVGYVDDYSIGVASSYFDTHNWETGYFVQDDWKVTPRLTLNLGVRYDLYTFPYTSHNYQSDFDLNPSSPTFAQLVQAGTNGWSNSQVNTNHGNFAPRFGFAYDLFGTGKTSVRGGYGIYYFQDRGGVGNQLSNNADFNGSVSYSSLPQLGGNRIMFSGQAPQCITNVAGCDKTNASATGALPLPAFGSTVNRADPTGVSLISIPRNLPTSMIQQFDLQVQQQLTPSTSLTVAYVGTTGQHLMTWVGPNAQVLGEAPNTFLFPSFEGINQGVAEGMSNYNGLQVFLNSRGFKGIQTTAAYTWSHTMSNSEGAFGTGSSLFFVFPTAAFTPGAMPSPNQALPANVSLKNNYGNSDQDQRQTFSFTALGELPFGKGKRFASNIPTAVDEIIGGWHLNTIVTLQTGQPFSITTGEYFYDGSNGGGVSLQGGGLTNFANASGRAHYTKSLHAWFDTSLYTHPAVIDPNGQVSTFIAPGNTARNVMTGPAYRDVDASLFKDFHIVERVAGQFRAEVFNLSNTPEFTNPNGNLDACQYTSGTTSTCPANASGLDNGHFGQIEGVRANSQREMQLALRFTF